MKKEILPIQIIENKIYIIRGLKVMLDSDLAHLYMVKPIALRQQVKRNKERFPGDFVFQLTKEEAHILVSQNVIPNSRYFGGSLPYAFTEHGVAMLSSVLKSKRAIEINILIIRAFVKIREMLSVHKDIVSAIEKLQREQADQKGHIIAIVQAINKLLAPPKEKRKNTIGFRTRE